MHKVQRHIQQMWSTRAPGVERACATSWMLMCAVMCAVGLSACCDVDDEETFDSDFNSSLPTSPVDGGSTLDVEAQACHVEVGLCGALGDRALPLQVSGVVTLTFEMYAVQHRVISASLELVGDEGSSALSGEALTIDDSDRSRAQLQVTLDAELLERERPYVLYLRVETRAYTGGVNVLRTREFGVESVPCALGPSSDVEDRVGDGEDQNCDGIDGEDADRDGHPSLASGGFDCDDQDPTLFTCDFGLTCIRQECVCQTPWCTPAEAEGYISNPDITSFERVALSEDSPVRDAPHTDASLANSMGATFHTLFTFAGIDINAYLADRIATGRFAIGAALQGTPDALDALDLVRLEATQGAEEGATFTINPSTFVPGSATPYGRFEDFDPETALPALKATSTPFVVVPFPFGEAELNVPVRDVQLDGVFGGLGEDEAPFVEGATLHGDVRVDDVFAAFDGYLQGPQCDCLGASEVRPSLLRYAQIQRLATRDDQFNAACDPPPTTQCGPDALCQTIAESCAAIVYLVEGGATRDTDDDGRDDVGGVVFVMDGVPATSEGVSPSAPSE